ncbi:MAG: hypothetical protein K2P98_03010, partial [Neisseriaceae bacterium]|nr:hypothetical protein [Neisseriaceae bacterium]
MRDGFYHAHSFLACVILFLEPGGFMLATHSVLAFFMLTYSALAGLHYWLFLGKKTALGFRWRHALLGLILAMHTPFVIHPFLAGMAGADTFGLGIMTTLVT